jgi:predicted O-methyltransferase YrrM
MAVSSLGEWYPPYRPTFDFSGPFIDADHRFYAACPVDESGVIIRVQNRRWLGTVIEGWLRRADALKLYEMAYFANGEILELGSFHGLSTSILSQANHNSKRARKILSVDLDPACVRHTKQTLRARRLAGHVEAVCSDALGAVRVLAQQQKKVGFVFVDHSHAYEPVYQVCRELKTILLKGGFCLFHDFNDARNGDSANRDYGVFQAVQDGLSRNEFEFYGVYGCTALYRAT